MIESLKNKLAVRFFEPVVTRVLLLSGWSQLPGDRWSKTLPSQTLLVTSRSDAVWRYLTQQKLETQTKTTPSA